MLLRFVSEAIADSPILVVGTYREREVRAHEQAELFAELAQLGTRLSLRGLSIDDVETYVAGVTDRSRHPP